MLSKAIKSLKSLTPVAQRSFAASQTGSANSGEAKRVVVTGAAGQIAYSTLFRIARYINRFFNVYLRIIRL